MRYPVNYVAITTKFTKGKHNGIDLGWNSNYGGKNQPIYAIEDGEVIYSKKQTTGGNVIHIYHKEYGYVSEYGHLKTLSLKVGDKVKKGQEIAKMGGTGIVVGNHLHFGLCLGKKITYTSKDKWVNPIEYLCLYNNQVANAKTLKSYKVYDTKEVTGVPNEPLMIHNAKNYNKSTECGKLYNGDEVEYYGKALNGMAVLDNIKGLYCSNKYIK